MAAANVVIRNAGSFEDTWKQVSAAWQKTVPALAETAQEEAAPAVSEPTPQGEMTVVRGRPRDSENIAVLMNRVLKDGQRTASDDDG